MNAVMVSESRQTRSRSCPAVIHSTTAVVSDVFPIRSLDFSSLTSSPGASSQRSQNSFASVTSEHPNTTLFPLQCAQQTMLNLNSEDPIHSRKDIDILSCHFPSVSQNHSPHQINGAHDPYRAMELQTFTKPLLSTKPLSHTDRNGETFERLLRQSEDDNLQMSSQEMYGFATTQAFYSPNNSCMSLCMQTPSPFTSVETFSPSPIFQFPYYEFFPPLRSVVPQNGCSREEHKNQEDHRLKCLHDYLVNCWQATGTISDFQNKYVNLLPNLVLISKWQYIPQFLNGDVLRFIKKKKALFKVVGRIEYTNQKTDVIFRAIHSVYWQHILSKWVRQNQ
jgi:hypothetical protein